MSKGKLEHSPELTHTHLDSGTVPFLLGLLPSLQALGPRGGLGLRFALGGSLGRRQPRGTHSLQLLAAARGLGICSGCWQLVRGTSALFHITPGSLFHTDPSWLLHTDPGCLLHITPGWLLHTAPGCLSMPWGCSIPLLVPTGCGTGSWGCPTGCAALLCRAQPRCFGAASFLPQVSQIPVAFSCISTGTSKSISNWMCSLTARGLDFMRNRTCVRQLCGWSWCYAFRRKRGLFCRDGCPFLCSSPFPFLLKKKKNKYHNVCLFIAKGKLYDLLHCSKYIFLLHRAIREQSGRGGTRPASKCK